MRVFLLPRLPWYVIAVCRANIRRASALGAKETDSDPPNESPCAESARRRESKWKRREKESIGHQSAPGDSRPEYLSLYFLSGMYGPFAKKESVFFDRRNYVCSRNECDRSPKGGIMRSAEPRCDDELEHADVHLSRAFRRPSGLRCICHVPLLVNGCY